MTIPIQPFNAQPQVMQGSFAPNPWTTGVPNLLRLLEMIQGDKQAQEQLEIARGNLAVQQQQEQRIARENELKQQNAQTEGEALRQALFSLTQPRPSGATVANAMQASGVQPAPGSPYEALIGSVQGLPAEAVPGAVRQALPVAQGLSDERLKAQQRADKLASTERALAAVPEPMREGARALVTFAELGANLPAGMQQTLFPNLFPPGKAVDPAIMNSATNMFTTSHFTWGQIRRMYGIPKLPDIDDNMKYVAPLSPGATGRAQRAQMQAANFLTQMVTSDAILTPLEEKTGGLSALGQYVKESQAAVRAGASSGVWGTLSRMVARGALNKDEQQVIAQSLNFGDAWRFSISGQSSSDTEGLRILNNVTVNAGDDPEVRHLKQNMRQVMIQGISDIAKGVRTRSEVLEGALRLKWTPEQTQWLKDQLRDAKAYEVQLENGTAPHITDPNPPTDPSDAASRTSTLFDAYRNGKVVTP